MPATRSCVLSIAGFDPSGGAGVLADVKTFEAHRLHGLGVVSALTFQNASEFDGLSWIPADEIIRQISVLLRRHPIRCVKIGLIQNLDVLDKLLDYLNTQSGKIKVIWDPILCASAGFQIHAAWSPESVTVVCRKLYLITPNVEEMRSLMGEADDLKAAAALSKSCNVLLKGGHRISTETHARARDYLFTTEGKSYSFRPKQVSMFPKHGSGCVLSAAITASLARGYKLHPACLRGKTYVTNFLNSNASLLGMHKI